jgi:hypothetical protein
MALPSSRVPPDLRFAAAPALARPGNECLPLGGGVELRVRSALDRPDLLPAYLLYADRDAALETDPALPDDALLERLAPCLSRRGDERQADLALAIGALRILDDVFRAAGLWLGNVYLAGCRGLESLIRALSWTLSAGAESHGLLRELAALELIYLFPVAAKFRQGAYDGEVQFRLNGWGRSLAAALPWPLTPPMSAGATAALTAHVRSHRDAYARHLGTLEVSRQTYAADVFAGAQNLPIPVLV